MAVSSAGPISARALRPDQSGLRGIVETKGSMKRLLFSGDGSSGDLLPMVLMAREFQLAGHEVLVCGSSEFAPMASDFGVPFEPYPHNYSEHYLDKQRTGYVYNVRQNIKHQEALFQGEYEVLSKVAPNFDVLFHLLHEVFVPSIAEAFGLMNIKLFTFPMVPSDRYGPPIGAPFITENRWVNRFEWGATEFSAWTIFSYYKVINELRAKLGLPPGRKFLAGNSRCNHMMMGVYEELIPPCPTWDFDYSYIGPCLPKAEVSLSDPLEAFLQRGSEPLYIGFGSMRHQNVDQLTRTLIGAARDTGVRLILAQNTSSIGADLDESDDVYILREYPIPHHILFPRCRAAVHHGSWITTHLAARAGVPQLVLPQASDQYIWADVLRRKGLGPKGVDMNRLSPRKLSKAIEQLVGRADFASNARELAERVEGIDGTKNAVRVFERLETSC